MQYLNLTDKDGEDTRFILQTIISHLQGILTVAVRLLESGIKPIFVFDGKAPTMKNGTVKALAYNSWQSVK